MIPNFLWYNASTINYFINMFAYSWQLNSKQNGFFSNSGGIALKIDSNFLFKSFQIKCWVKLDAVRMFVTLYKLYDSTLTSPTKHICRLEKQHHGGLINIEKQFVANHAIEKDILPTQWKSRLSYESNLPKPTSEGKPRLI